MKDSTTAFFAPFMRAFVEHEGSWFWTGGDEENGSSSWAAEAQQLMAEPLNSKRPWVANNEFHLLSDENKIPPYYRAQHRPNITLGTDGRIYSSTVTQLRYVELSVTQAGVGLNGNAIIKEEKLAVLGQPDLGVEPVSAIEIATKLASRQLVFNRTGEESPDSLDDGDRCAAINQKAYEWALSAISAENRERFQKYGLPMKMAADKKPNPPAGPFWIWKYLETTETSTELTVQSFIAFYSLSANPYGAGNHYCKLLSPARALEWVMTDGLRAKYHL